MFCLYKVRLLFVRADGKNISFAEKNLNSGYFCYTFRCTEKISLKTLNSIDRWLSVGVVKKDCVTEAIEFANGIMTKIIPGRAPVVFCEKFSG